MPPIKATRGTLLALFVVSILIVAGIRVLQGLDAFENAGALIVGGALLTPLLFGVLRIQSDLGKVIALIWLAAGIALLVVTWYQLQIYGILTGLAYVSFITGPVVTLPPLIISLVLVVPQLRARVGRGLILGGAAAVGAALLVGILRSLQHLDPVWDTTVVLIFAILNGAGGFLTGVGLFDPRKLVAGEPGLPRATAMAIIGFLLGGLAVIVVRGLQSLDPIWDPGIGITLIAFVTTGFFVSGMGAFDPKMSVHGEGHAGAEHTKEAEADDPLKVLGTFIWQSTFLVLLVLLVIAVVALLPGGPGLKTTDDPTASPFIIGAFTMQLPGGGPEVQLSKLVVFVLFAIFTVLSLAVFGGGIALLFYFLNKNVIELSRTKPTEAELTPPPLVQSVGTLAAGASGWLRHELPKLLGQR